MNKSHITSDQVDKAVAAYLDVIPACHIDWYTMRRALEAAFPEQTFGSLVVTEEMAKQFYNDIGYSMQYPPVKALQSFVDRNSTLNKI